MVNYNTDLARLKRSVGTAKATNDTMLQENLDAAYNYINERLDKFTTVPLDSAPETIVHIETLLASGWFRMQRCEEEDDDLKGATNLNEGKRLLRDFIQDNYTKDEVESLLEESGWHEYQDSSWDQDIE